MKAEHTLQIDNYLKSEGFKDRELIDDLKDHMATEIEFLIESGKGFDESFELAKTKLLPETPYQLEKDLKLLTTQKHNIMIKKIAFLGGYLSCTSLVLALLLFSQALLGDKKDDLKVSSIQAEYGVQRSIYDTGVGSEEMSEALTTYILNSRLKKAKYFEVAETLLTTSFLLLILTYLPYRFYNGYQKSELELT